MARLVQFGEFTMPAYRILGTTDEVTTCDCCGRANLLMTIALAPLDADGNAGEPVHFGTSCAAKAAKQPAKAVRSALSRLRVLRAQAADRAEFWHPLREERDAEMAKVNALGFQSMSVREPLLARYFELDAQIRADVKAAVAAVTVSI